MKISPARVSAFDILKRIELENAFSSALLASADGGLSQLDRNLCHQLVLGVLRKQIYLDRVIRALAGSKKMDLAVRLALRLGLYQLLFLDKIPDFSAVNESVNLVVRARKVSAKGFVNAVLRRAIRGEFKIEFAGEMDRIATETSHPRWLIDRWVSQFGSETAVAIAQANNEQPKIAFRILHDRDLEVSNAVPSEFVDGCFMLERPTDDYMQLAAEGSIYLQDEGSQLIAHAVEPAARIIDICAAPGGKTGLIAALNQSSHVFAGDLRSSRVVYLKANCENQGVSVPIVQYDATRQLPFSPNSFGSVFVDAPCSGTGTIRHNPELRYLIKEADIFELQNKQLAILNNASEIVDSGGTLLYSTCSLEREENEAVCAEFLDRHPDYTPISPNVPSVFRRADGTARTWPHLHRMDGFFLAAFRKA